MKRDKTLVREILIELEKRTFGQEYSKLVIEGHNSEEIMYHVKLLYKANLIHTMDMSGSNDMNFLPGSLTWDGHEYLELARNETRWNKAKDIMKNQVGGFVFDILKQLLIVLANEAILQS